MRVYSASVALPDGLNFDSSLNFEASLNAVKACVYRLAVDRGICFGVDLRSFKVKADAINFNKSTRKVYGVSQKIPYVIYDDALVSYYKAAITSTFSSQKYLDFYHIFEYLFLKVSEESIYSKVRTYVNAPGFRSNDEDIGRLISIIKKNESENDETEMLKKVFVKYIDEDNLIEFLKGQGMDGWKDKLFFGEKFTITLKPGHVIGNIAKLLKHVRNALVHSSDRYKREDCHIPFSESESQIDLLNPTMEFLAQKIIAGTAKPLE
jgi:hypothetical protein